MTRLRIGGLTTTVGQASTWTASYFDASANTAGGNPYAYPLYDRLVTDSGPDELNDGDLIAPVALNARPSIRALYSLQRVRTRLEQGLAAVPLELTLQEAVAAGSHSRLLAGLVGPIDPHGLPDVRLTTLAKILHRKRPLFFPLYDSRVRACYVGSGAAFPMHDERGRTDSAFATGLAECIAADLDEQDEIWRHLSAAAPDDVTLLRTFDVVAWNLGGLVT